MSVVFSDLPSEEKSPVLLLSITRIPSSPTPPRRPCSLPLRGTLTYPTVVGVDSSSETASAKWSIETVDTSNSSDPLQRNLSSSTFASSPISASSPAGGGSEATLSPSAALEPSRSAPTESKNNLLLATTAESTDSGGGDCFLLSSSYGSGCDVNSLPARSSSTDSSLAAGTAASAAAVATSANYSHAASDLAKMDRSVDSIGTCSLDVDVSAVDNSTDWSGTSSVGTLRSASLLTPPQEKRLPSYLSLACTVNGYSTITNYDSCRLARSREVSPHRPFSHEPQLSSLGCTSTISPSTMSDNRLSHQEFYTNSSTKTMTYMSKTSHSFSSAVYKESVDGCVVRNGSAMQNNFIEYKATNGNSKSVSETSIQHSYANGQGERKSFIQQRVERLYGPGALAQGFFVSKRQRNGTSESDNKAEGYNKENEQHSKSSSNVLADGDDAESKMKQSTSSPALPVLRHLRPEFRAQLPIISPRKMGEFSSTMQKSSTVPALKDQAIQNGHASKVEKSVPIVVPKDVTAPPKESNVKDGHYFIEILQKEIKRILALAEKAEVELEKEDLPEDAKGYLRSASGKARLLCTQKMQQFEGLCRNNITQDESVQFPTTNEDLQGFWDMVLLQVAQVDKIYEELDVLRANDWKETEKPGRDVTDSSKIRTNKTSLKARPQSAANEAARKAREAARKQIIEERRKAMRNQKQDHQSIEIFVPETS